MILEKLWRGKVNPQERGVRENSEYQKISHRTTELEKLIYKELSAEGQVTFDEYIDNEAYFADIAEQDAFIKGVRFGAKFILDVQGEYNSQLPQIIR